MLYSEQRLSGREVSYVWSTHEHSQVKGSKREFDAPQLLCMYQARREFYKSVATFTQRLRPVTRDCSEHDSKPAISIKAGAFID
jgi:hypothetical protein